MNGVNVNVNVNSPDAYRTEAVCDTFRSTCIKVIRVHTGKPDGIPKEVAEKIVCLINMSPRGDYGLTPVIPRLLAKYKAALNTKQMTVTAQRNKPVRRPCKRKGPP